MPLFRSTTNAVAFKLAVVGPRQSGKRTVLRALARTFAGTQPPRSRALNESGTSPACQIVWAYLSAPWLTDVGLGVDLYAMAACGCEPTSLARSLVYEAADAVLFVADSRSSQASSNLACLAELRRVSPSAPLVVLSSRRDLDGLLSSALIAALFGLSVSDVFVFDLADDGTVASACARVLELLRCTPCAVPAARPSPVRTDQNPRRP